MVADRLGINQATFAGELSVDGGASVTIRRDTDVASERVTIAGSAGRRLGDRPDRRSPLPRIQGDHGRQEEADHDHGRWPTSASPPLTSRLGAASVKTQVDVSPTPARTAGTIVTDDGTGAAQVADFLADRGFI
jgi:electron transfer flavoprotein beta subunit